MAVAQVTVAQVFHHHPKSLATRGQRVAFAQVSAAASGAVEVPTVEVCAVAAESASVESAIQQLRHLSDAELVCYCQQQHPHQVAFAELIRRYQSHVDKLLYHFSLEFSDRADLSQEIWIRVYRYIPRLKEPNRFKPWLSRIATNLFYDTLRKRKRFASIVSLDASRQTDEGPMDWEVAAEGPGPIETMMTQEFYERLQAAIAELPEIFQQTIILREIKGLTYDEIAEITKVSLGTVKSRIARARCRLQDELEGYVGKSEGGWVSGK
ncbi:MAG: sigma-70 family RNA polymerase sigma factor [Cyanobacteria bacterium P01_A01_bin.114]